MYLIKETEIDKIEVLNNGTIQVRQVSRIIEDGNELSKSFHRWILLPGDDVSQQEERVQTIAHAAWTPEVVAAFQTQQSSI